jgi:5-methyltetrahydropteroyltriglutamate--homocysteine methyltransferase
MPKSPELMRARAQLTRGEISAEQLGDLERQATREWMDIQTALGIDILVDGEQDRGDMVTVFAERMEGFELSGLVRSYGNRYYRKPIAVGPVGRSGPMTLDIWRYAQSLTDRPVKGMLTGPYTIAEWSFNSYYPNRREFILEIARAIREEALDLQRAGATYIQIDEPAIMTRVEDLDLAIEADALVTSGLQAKTITHICYGEFELLGPRLNELPFDQIDLEFANRDFETLDTLLAQRFDKEIAMGVVDVHTHVVEPLEKPMEGIRRALEFLPPERLIIDPDCGLKTRTAEEAVAKLQVMQQARDEIRRLQGL